MSVIHFFLLGLIFVFSNESLDYPSMLRHRKYSVAASSYVNFSLAQDPVTHYMYAQLFLGDNPKTVVKFCFSNEFSYTWIRSNLCIDCNVDSTTPIFDVSKSQKTTKSLTTPEAFGISGDIYTDTCRYESNNQKAQFNLNFVAPTSETYYYTGLTGCMGISAKTPSSQLSFSFFDDLANAGLVDASNIIYGVYMNKDLFDRVGSHIIFGISDPEYVYSSNPSIIRYTNTDFTNKANIWATNLNYISMGNRKTIQGIYGIDMSPSGSPIIKKSIFNIIDNHLKIDLNLDCKYTIPKPGSIYQTYQCYTDDKRIISKIHPLILHNSQSSSFDLYISADKFAAYYKGILFIDFYIFNDDVQTISPLMPDISLGTASKGSYWTFNYIKQPLSSQVTIFTDFPGNNPGSTFSLLIFYVFLVVIAALIFLWMLGTFKNCSTKQKKIIYRIKIIE